MQLAKFRRYIHNVIGADSVYVERQAQSQPSEICKFVPSYRQGTVSLYHVSSTCFGPTGENLCCKVDHSNLAALNG